MAVRAQMMPQKASRAQLPLIRSHTGAQGPDQTKLDMAPEPSMGLWKPHLVLADAKREGETLKV